MKLRFEKMYSHSANILKYTAPKWTQRLNNIPDIRLSLGHLNTPIHRWRCPRVSPEIELYIKRDDMTGSTLSGNKVRKLEFILAEAIRSGRKHVITCGGIQSNFARTAAVAARQLGMKSHLILRSDILNPAEIGCTGNVALDRLMGSDIYLIPKYYKEKDQIQPLMLKLAEKIQSETEEESCIIGVGGSDSLGVFGYLEAFQELMEQNVLEHFDDVITAIGSGGTAAGLAIGNYLNGSKLRIHAVCVCDGAEYFHDHINKTLRELGLNDVRSEDIIDIIEGYKGLGYGLSRQEELDFIVETSEQTGIVLDHVYTGKAAYALVNELEKNRNRFKGKRILFLHTGGIYGALDGTLEPTLLKPDASTNRIFSYTDL